MTYQGSYMSTKTKTDWGVLKRLATNRGTLFVVIILISLLAFELLNYSTTQYALSGMLGERALWGIAWATILAVAFCGIDFAGIARVFTPEQDGDEPEEVWYLLGAWLLAAGFNAVLTYFAIRGAITTNPNGLLQDPQMVKYVPYLIAIFVWLIRVLLILSFSKYADRLVDQVRTKEPSVPPRSDYSAKRSGYNMPQAPQRQYSATTIQRPPPTYPVSGKKG